ncbi:hypothetical protein SAMN05192583_3423 [Sphingomonas gellani]|uniref:DUF4136 domain-containing protein n=1 Tax=Sphingomonas gellani TaxID=1166340 RepID=A0A1H8IX46_9SPHN|nr:hypothetical protein [Sphingomonas gellani]SEN73062.1 hypothetical protein SAMN05192583_3423 [Sphingomonas gellani]
MLRPLVVLGLAGLGLAACTTTSPLPPTQVIRYHLASPSTPIARGTIAVEPLPGGAPASLEFASYAAAVQDQLLRNGYTLAAPGTRSDFVATVDFHRSTADAPPRRSPVSIGLGGGGYSGGYRGGGVGLGGGLSFPIGGNKAHSVIVTELKVIISRRAVPGAAAGAGQLWDGSARGFADLKASDADADAQARRIAAALFMGFPGESGRTVEVK